ncbi:MAG: hypothetical protein EOP49_10250 [Sphingobacteriales bacterium]|nr:MAG: hypothetical protein EOP49_10250 [Sphingobacteriales bacterium]
MELLKAASILSALVPLAAGYRNRKALLWYYPLAALSVDCLTLYLKHVAHLPFAWITNYYLVAEFLILCFVFRPVLAVRHRLFYFFIGAALLFFTITALPQNARSFNQAGASLFSFSYIAMGIAGLYLILRQQQILYLEKSWFFWLNTALILYASGNFLIFLFSDLRYRETGLFLDLWQIFQVLNITKNILLSPALYFYESGRRTR